MRTDAMNTSEPKAGPGRKERSIRLRYGTAAAVFAAAAVLLLIAVNVVFTLLVERYNWKADMTSAGMYSLTEDSKRVLSSLEDEIDVRVFSTEDDFFPELREIFSRCAALSRGMLRVEYLDPYLNDGMILDYAREGLQVGESDVVIEGAGRKKVYDPLEFYEIDYDSYEITGFRAEQVLMSAVGYVTGDRLPTVVFSVGHDETISRGLLQIFSNNNFQTEDAYLANGAVPETADILVIASPGTDYSPDELSALDDFLLRGGKLMVFAAPSRSNPLPRLRGFLEEWGIRLTELTVLEPESHVLGNPLNLQTVYAEHPITDAFDDYRVFTVAPNARALEKTFESRGGVVVREVLTSTAEAYGKTDVSLRGLQREEGDPAGPFALALASTRLVKVGTEQKTAQVFAMGCTGVYAQDVMEAVSYGNTAFLGQAVQWCTEEDVEILNVPSRSYRIETLAVPARTGRIFGQIILLWVPLGCLALGAGVWLKRRHL